jgi:hypothetical protein
MAKYITVAQLGERGEEERRREVKHTAQEEDAAPL